MKNLFFPSIILCGIDIQKQLYSLLNQFSTIWHLIFKAWTIIFILYVPSVVKISYSSMCVVFVYNYCYNERATKYQLLNLHYIAEESLQVVTTVTVDQNDGCAELPFAYIQIMRKITKENAT